MMWHFRESIGGVILSEISRIEGEKNTISSGIPGSWCTQGTYPNCLLRTMLASLKMLMENVKGQFVPNQVSLLIFFGETFVVLKHPNTKNKGNPIFK